MRLKKAVSEKKRILYTIGMAMCPLKSSRVQASVFRKIISAFCIVVFALSSRAESWQYTANEAGSFTQSSWKPVNGKTNALVTLHSSNGWFGSISRIPVGARHVVSFDRVGGLTPSPLIFAGSPTQSVAYAFIIVYSPSPRDQSTLLDFPYNVRLHTTPRTGRSRLFFETVMANGTWQPSSTEISVNGTNDTEFFPSQGFQLVEVKFAPKAELLKIRLGGAIPTYLWKNEWQGGIGEIIFLTENPTFEEREALKFYAHKRWRVDVTPPDMDSRHAADILKSLEIVHGFVVSTLIIVR